MANQTIQCQGSPDSQQLIPPYFAVVSPVLGSDAVNSQPIATGNAASFNGDLRIQVNTGNLEEPMDAYFLLLYQTDSTSLIFYFDNNGGLQAFKKDLYPWKKEVTSINESLFGAIPRTYLPEGEYTFYLLLAPAGSNPLESNFYLWIMAQHINDISILPLSSGGSLEFEKGSLPENVKLAVEETIYPSMPEGLIPVGKSLNITVDSEPKQPVTLRLPVPDGEDAENLVIVRTEEDGTTSLLSTRVEGDELMAETPGFSNFSTAEIEKIVLEGLGEDNEKKEIRRLSFSGPTSIGPDSLGYYQLVPTGPLGYVSYGDVSWTLSGGSVSFNPSREMTHSLTAIPSRHVYTGKYNPDNKTFTLSANTKDNTTGIRQSASRNILLVSQSQLKNSGDTIYVREINSSTLIAGKHKLIVKTEFSSFVSKINDEIYWSWDFGDKSEDAKGSSIQTIKNDPYFNSNWELIFNLPSHLYKLPDMYTLLIKAENSRTGIHTEVALHIYILPDSLSVKLDKLEDKKLIWYPPDTTGNAGVTGDFKLEIEGGTAPYNTQWQVNPESSVDTVSNDTETASIEFLEPGSYLLIAKVTDSEGKQAESWLMTTIGGGLPLRFEINDRDVNERTLSALINIFDGKRVVAGKKRGYTVKIDWGDGTDVEISEDVGLAKDYAEGTVIPVSHTYQQLEGQKYTITMTVFDALGAKEVKTFEIDKSEIPEPEPEPEPVPEPDGKTLVLNEIILTKYNGASGDECPDSTNTSAPICRHNTYLSSGIEQTTEYTLDQHKASMTFEEVYIGFGTEHGKHHDVYSDYTVTFNFDSPPSTIKAGETLSFLKIDGKAEGFTKGWSLKRGFVYYSYQEGQKAHYLEDDAIYISNREMPYDENTGLFQGTFTPEYSPTYTVIEVPDKPGDVFTIGGRFGWDPAFFIEWKYRLE